MTRISAVLAVVACLVAASVAKKHRRNEHISEDVNLQNVELGSENQKPKHHAFAISFRIPRIRLLPQGMAMGMMNDMKSEDPNTKTHTKTTNSTNGPFRTFTVTKESVSHDNNTNSSVIMETVKSITTLDKNLTPEQKKKLASGEIQDDEHHGKIPNLFHWNFRLPFGVLADQKEAPKPECDEKASCKSDHFCDDGKCAKSLAPGARCFMKDQCSSDNGKYQCTWGVCALNSESGSPGTFCDDDKSCGTSQEMTCRFQNDISPRAKVCLPKLTEEGAYCGKVSFFGFFTDDHDFNMCKTGLKCKVVGFRGIKRCVKEEEFPESLEKDSSKPEEISSDEEKTREEAKPAENDQKQEPEQDKKPELKEENLVFTSKHHHHHHHHN